MNYFWKGQQEEAKIQSNIGPIKQKLVTEGWLHFPHFSRRDSSVWHSQLCSSTFLWGLNSEVSLELYYFTPYCLLLIPGNIFFFKFYKLLLQLWDILHREQEVVGVEKKVNFLCFIDFVR